MEIHVFTQKAEMGRAAAQHATSVIHQAIERNGKARIVLATGASQFEMLDTLVQQTIDWSQVSAFHLDEYIGLPLSHPASFRRYLQERFVDRLPGLSAFYAIDGQAADPQRECVRLGEVLLQAPVDLACIGIGENGHLAFNDPPADFDTKDPFLVVDLDPACRSQQVGEGWFASLAEVPTQAISMSIRQILQAKQIVCTVPDARKARALRDTVQGEVSPLLPASILQRHAACHLFADQPATSLMEKGR